MFSNFYSPSSVASSFTDSGPDRGFDRNFGRAGPGLLKISGPGPVWSYISGKYTVIYS